jgi:hypothetical protein
MSVLVEKMKKRREIQTQEFCGMLLVARFDGWGREGKNGCSVCAVRLCGKQ